MKNELFSTIRQMRIDASISATLFVPETTYRQLIEEQAVRENLDEELLTAFVAGEADAAPVSQQRPSLRTDVSLLWRIAS